MSSKILTITGPTCSGKTTLLKALEETGRFQALVGFTTRKPRAQEIAGVDYHFLTVEEARNLIENGKAVEHVFYNGNYYGILASEIERAEASGKIPAVILEPGGVVQFQQLFGEKIFPIFIYSPLSVLLSRYLSRFALDTNADLSYYVKRLEGLIHEYADWDYGKQYLEVFVCSEETLPKIVEYLVKEL